MLEAEGIGRVLAGERRLQHQLAHHMVREQQPPELPAHQPRGLTAQDDVCPLERGLDLGEGGLDRPASLVEPGPADQRPS